MEKVLPELFGCIFWGAQSIQTVPLDAAIYLPKIMKTK